MNSLGSGRLPFVPMMEAADLRNRHDTALGGRRDRAGDRRILADQRSDPQALRRILVPVQATGSVEDLGGGNVGAGASTPAGGMVASSAAGTGGGMGFMGGGG